MFLNARCISGEAGQTKLIPLAMEDITGRRSQDLWLLRDPKDLVNLNREGQHDDPE